LPTLAIDLKDEGPPPVFLLGGELDVATGLRLTEVLLPGLRREWDDLVLDLTWLHYLDSQGLQAILRLATAARGRILLRNAQGLARFVLETSDVLASTPNLRLEPRVGQAVDVLSPPPSTDARPGPRPSVQRRPVRRSAPPAAIRRLTSHPGQDGPGRPTPHARPA